MIYFRIVIVSVVRSRMLQFEIFRNICSKLAVFHLYYIIVIWLNDLEALSGALQGFQSIIQFILV